MKYSDIGNTPTNIVAVVPAAGVGSRMQSPQPKQYFTIAGKTILQHSVDALLAHSAIQRVIIAICAEDGYFFDLPLAQNSRIQTVYGGAQRADSVMAGLRVAQDADWVLVHDAARPCLGYEDLNRLLALYPDSHMGGILATPVRDTMKRAQTGRQFIAKTVEREALWHALTPQFFPRELLTQCLQRALAEGAIITDEASALEYCGYHPKLVEGRANNLKVTCPEDLVLAEFYLTGMLNSGNLRKNRSHKE